MKFSKWKITISESFITEAKMIAKSNLEALWNCRVNILFCSVQELSKAKTISFLLELFQEFVQVLPSIRNLIWREKNYVCLILLMDHSSLFVSIFSVCNLCSITTFVFHIPFSTSFQQDRLPPLSAIFQAFCFIWHSRPYLSIAFTYNNFARVCVK